MRARKRRVDPQPIQLRVSLSAMASRDARRRKPQMLQAGLSLVGMLTGKTCGRIVSSPFRARLRQMAYTL
ncbi:hypothetical protein YH67_10015 [Stenotrophomonas maltophilia]|uniref:Uncharacterized protein n=1 Tax=Stenotrophomonas geniculata N1 TaxID=1167641 RepID=A0A0L8AD29_9GAMM|nr:hypothetical protein YH67_10015 [Stenotrophomonas maltophilia]ALA90543.1 hypothetical protein YH68_10015 [Stenotrophomonas maltophilia]KOF00293.1 hypothetical protein W7K_05580 [Stenotrophomonas geniculata N1]KRG45687.1 hypothetical protein ARC63_07440 [Stenotrophomonas geniculata ATCC 19374 = JCM 13324]HCL44391.1 hypothetical protein [Pseudomonas sp.]